jgi:hypothetical protein
MDWRWQDRIVARSDRRHGDCHAPKSVRPAPSQAYHVRRRPQFGDLPQDLGEQHPWHGDVVCITHHESSRYRNTRVALWPGGNLFLLGQNHHLIHHRKPSVPFYRYKSTFDAMRLLREDNCVRIEGFWPKPHRLEASCGS